MREREIEKKYQYRNSTFVASAVQTSKLRANDFLFFLMHFRAFSGTDTEWYQTCFRLSVWHFCAQFSTSHTDRLVVSSEFFLLVWEFSASTSDSFLTKKTYSNSTTGSEFVQCISKVVCVSILCKRHWQLDKTAVWKETRPCTGIDGTVK